MTRPLEHAYASTSEDIAIPVIEITKGWTVDDLETMEDCDDAFCVLTGIIVSIEAQLAELEYAGVEKSQPHRSAKAALRWKKAALQIVQRKQAMIQRREARARDAVFDRSFIHYVNAYFPEVADKAKDAAKLRSKGASHE